MPDRWRCIEKVFLEFRPVVLWLYIAMDLLSDASSDSEDGGAQLRSDSLQVNEEYARKFEHNKKREERQKRMYNLSQIQKLC